MSGSPYTTNSREQPATEALALVTAAIDLRGEIDSAQANLGNVEKLVKDGKATDHDSQQARIKLETLSRKRAAIDVTIDADRQTCQAEIKSLQAAIELRKKDGQDTSDLDARIARVEARLKTLEMAR